MLQFVKIMTVVNYFLPILAEVIRLVEGFAKGVLSGAEKKERALALLRTIYGGMQQQIKEIKDVPFELFEGILSLLIDSVVALANATGVFTSSKPS